MSAFLANYSPIVFICKVKKNLTKMTTRNIYCQEGSHLLAFFIIRVRLKVLFLQIPWRYNLVRWKCIYWDVFKLVNLQPENHQLTSNTDSTTCVFQEIYRNYQNSSPWWLNWTFLMLPYFYYSQICKSVKTSITRNVIKFKLAGRT